MSAEKDSGGESRKRVTHYEYTDDSSWSFDFRVRPGELNEFLDSTTEFVDDAKLQITTDGLKVLAVDPANCVLVEDTRPPVYSLGGVTTVGVNLTRLKRELPSYAREDWYTVEVISADDELRVRSPHGEGTAPMFTPDSAREMPDLPDVEHEQEFTIPAFRWNGAVGAVARAAHNTGAFASPSVNLTPSDGQLVIEANPDHPDDGPYSWTLPEAQTVSGETGIYSADYLAEITSGLPDTEELTVRFGDEQPLEVEADGLRYLQAARVEVDNDGE